MKLDAHVHTHYSGNTTLKPIDSILKESYNTPESLYRLAKSRGMDLVTITDHDAIAGALTIADRKDVIVGCEITAVFPEDGVTCHIGVLGIDEEQHREIQKLRKNVHELVRYLNQQEIFCILNHLASETAGSMTAGHIYSLLPWLDALETRNGTRLPSQNRTATAIALAHGKVTAAGSDSHTYRGIGKTYMVCDNATNREEFLFELKQGRVRVEGREGGFFTLSSDIIRIAANFYIDEVVKLIEKPLDWRRHLKVLCASLGMPMVTVALGVALVHFIRDDRFNDNLLVDLVASPSGLRPAAPPVRALDTESYTMSA